MAMTFKVKHNKGKQLSTENYVVIFLTSDVIVCESLVELLEVCVVDVLKYKSWRSAHRVLSFCNQFLGRN